MVIDKSHSDIIKNKRNVFLFQFLHQTSLCFVYNVAKNLKWNDFVMSSGANVHDINALWSLKGFQSLEDVLRNPHTFGALCSKNVI